MNRFTVFINILSRRHETDKGNTLLFSERDKRTFNDLESAKRYARNLERSLRDEMDTIYVYDNSEVLTYAQLMDGKVITSKA